MYVWLCLYVALFESMYLGYNLLFWILIESTSELTVLSIPGMMSYSSHCIWKTWDQS